MGRRRKQKVRDPSIEEVITEQVSNLLSSATITPAQVMDLLLSGHRMYKWNGISTQVAWKAILDGFKDHDRYYLTPGQNASLHGREEPTPEDFEHLSK